MAYREWDDALVLTANGGERLAEARTGRNRRHLLVGLLRQSVFGRLAGYEDVNDAERLCRDPAMRWVVGGNAPTGRAASASQMGRFETEWLVRPENLAALADLPGQWIDTVHQRRQPKIIVLDMDSSQSPTYGEQEGSAYNGHFGCTCYHPLFVFNQLGDLERCALRPGNVHSAEGWRAVLEPVVVRYRGRVKRLYFRGDAAFANPEVYEFLEAESIGYAIRLPANRVLQAAQAPGRATAIGGAPLLFQLRLPGRLMEQAPPSGGQGRMAPRRALSARRFHRHQSGAAGRARGCLLQPPRHLRAIHQRGQGRDQVDPAVVPFLRRQRGSPPAPCLGLQPLQFHADAGDAQDRGTVVADQLAGEADQDRRQGGQPRALRYVSDGRGRGVATDVPGNSVADRPAPNIARPSMTGRLGSDTADDDGRGAP